MSHNESQYIPKNVLCRSFTKRINITVCINLNWRTCFPKKNPIPNVLSLSIPNERIPPPSLTTVRAIYGIRRFLGVRLVPELMFLPQLLYLSSPDTLSTPPRRHVDSDLLRFLPLGRDFVQSGFPLELPLPQFVTSPQLFFRSGIPHHRGSSRTFTAVRMSRRSYKNAPSVAAEGAESNIRASTLDGFILLAVAKKSILFVNYALFLCKRTMRPAKLPLDRTELLVLSYEVHHEENYLKQEHE